MAKKTKSPPFYLLLFIFTVMNTELLGQQIGLNEFNIESINLNLYSSNIFVENILEEEEIYETRSIEDQENLSFTFKRKSGIALNISLSNIKCLNQYEDVQHISENRIVLDSDPRSNMHYLKKPLTNIINKYCRHPLPSGYYITMDSFPNRLTAAEIFPKFEKENTIHNCISEFKNDQKCLYRSVNKSCMKQIGGALLIVKDKSHLSIESNSLYCTKNSPIVKLFVNSSLRDTIAFYQDTNCETYRKQCDHCFIVNCGIGFNNIARSACPNTFRCLTNSYCINFYALKCNEKTDICLEGTTLKFSLTPEFLLTESSFQCHLRRIDISKKILADISIEFIIPKMDKSIKFVEHLKANDIQKISILNLMEFTIQYSSNLILENNIILNFNNSTMSVSGHHPDNAQFRKPITIHKHQNQKYAKIKMPRPFYYNSQTWFNESCNIDISKLIDAKDEFENEFEKVKLKSKDNRPRKLSSGKFVYEFVKEGQFDVVQINLKKRTSILNSIFCNKFDKSGLLTDLNIKITHNSKSQIWLKLSGYVSQSLSYLNLTLAINQILAQQFDIVIYKSFFNNPNKNPFWLEFQILLNPNDNHTIVPFVLILYLSDCYQTLIRYINFHTELNTTKTPMDIFGNSTTLFEYPSKGNIMEFSSNVLLMGWISLTFIVIFLWLLLSIKTIKFVQKTKSSWFTKNKLLTSKITMKKRSIIIMYIILRIIYSFLFTFTTILSLILALKHEHHLKSIEQNNLSFHSMKNLKSINRSSLINCSNVLRTNLNNNLEKFKNKRWENNDIFYNSRQSIQNETLRTISIFQQNLKEISNRQKQSIIQSIILSSNIYQNLYLKHFDQIIDSNWFNQPLLIANKSKYFHRKKSNDLIWLKNINMEKIIFQELINISEMLLSVQSVNILKEKYEYLNGMSSNLLNPKSVKAHQLHINISISFRYMESVTNKIRQRNASDLSFNKKSRSQSKSTFNLLWKLHGLSFNTLFIRIIMMIIDLFLITYRGYRLFSHVNQFLRGRKSFFQYKCPSLYSSISKKDSIIVDESSFMQLTTKMAPWTKQQNLYCLNSFDVIITIHSVILSIICGGLLICLASKESSIFIMPLIHSNSHSNSWWFISYKIKVFQLKPQTPMKDHWNEERFNIWKQILLLRQNLTFMFNDNERNIINQYMWEQCYFEKIHPNTSWWNNKNLHSKPSKAGYCQMPLPQNLVYYNSISCDFQNPNLFMYSYFIRRRKIKDRPFFIHLFRLYIVEICFTIFSLTIIIFSLIGSLNILKRILQKHCVPDSDIIVLLISQFEGSVQQNSLENSFLISEVNESCVTKDCSKKSYSCYKTDTFL